MVVVLVATLLAIVGCKSEITVDPLDDNFIVFYSDTEFTVTPSYRWYYFDTSNYSFNSDNSILECSTDNTNWVVLDRNIDLKQTAVKSGDKYYLYFRGAGINSITSNGYGRVASWALDGNNIYCSGNIENLLDYKAVSRGEHPQMANYCFLFLFQNCTALVSAPTLPSTELSKSCYGGMFYGCTSLTQAPELPAITLAELCYQSMFASCTSLETAPELKATTLADWCYCSMFNGCKKLNSVTCLATNIDADNCLLDWLTGTAATGTFTKAKDVNIWSNAVGGNVPAGWTITE